jgi:PAS domain S-box-containing protein
MTRVLVVDDEYAIRMLLKAILTMEGYAVDLAEDVKSGLALLEAGAFDLVITDITLPGLSGVDLLHIIREKHPRVQVILLTGMPNVETAAEAVRSGAFDYLSKPVERNDILRVVANAVKVKALDDERERLTRENKQYAERLEQMVAGRTKALAETESRYRRLFESARDGILLLDGETGRIVDVNPFLTELLGYARDYFLDKILWDIPLFKNVALSKVEFAKLHENHQIGCEDLPLETRDGRRIEVDFISHAYQAGDTRAIQCNVRDVTGRNTALTRLRNLNELQSKFVAEASHEIRTPLTIIKESVRQVVDGVCGPLTAEQKEILGVSLQAIERLKAVVNDLLDISKLEAGKTVLRRQRIDLLEVMEDVRALFQGQAESKGIRLLLVGDRDNVTLYADRGRIIQILTNLVGNAVKFTPRGSITLSLAARPDYVECAVADTGIGIAEADLPKVFGRFLQFGSSYTGPGGGTGLGLSIAKSLVELHGGKIRVNSALDKGTTFTFTLPRIGVEQLISESGLERESDSC